MHRRKKVDEKSCVISPCVTSAGTSNELDVQNKWEENTHTSRPSEHSPVKGKKCQNVCVFQKIIIIY